MQQPLPFDTSIYYSYVADNMLKNLGEKALIYADEALVKMRSLGDDEGLDIWMNIHEHLTIKACSKLRPAHITVH